jgi:hypothetical protein
MNDENKPAKDWPRTAVLDCILTSLQRDPDGEEEERKRKEREAQQEAARIAGICEELSKLGAVGMDVEKSCAIAEITIEEFEASEEFQNAYKKGQYKGEYLWRSAIFKGAKDGIPQMCKLFQTIFTPAVIANNPEISMGDYYDTEWTIPEEHTEQIDDSGAGSPAEEGEVDQSDATEDSGDSGSGMPEESRRDD